MSAQLTGQGATAGAGAIVLAAAARAADNRPTGEELARQAADALRARMARGEVKDKGAARRAARKITKQTAGRYYKRESAEFERVRAAVAEIAEAFSGRKENRRRGR